MQSIRTGPYNFTQINDYIGHHELSHKLEDIGLQIVID